MDVVVCWDSTQAIHQRNAGLYGRFEVSGWRSGTQPDGLRDTSHGLVTFMQSVETGLPVLVQLRLFGVDGADLATRRPDGVP